MPALSQLLKATEAELNHIIKEEFKGLSNPNSLTMILSFLQMHLNCCGAKNGSDYLNAAHWNRTYSVRAGLSGTNHTTLVSELDLLHH